MIKPSYKMYLFTDYNNDLYKSENVAQINQ